MIRLSDEHHERLWRICDGLVSGAGARAAMICDADGGAVLVSAGDSSGSGAVAGIEPLGPGERVVRGAGGQIYGVDIPGGALLAVLHDVPALESVRALAAEAVHDIGELLASLPPAPAEPAHDHAHAHAHPQETSRQKPRKKPAKRKAVVSGKRRVAASKRGVVRGGASPPVQRRRRSRRSTKKK